jgi:hypothetical protein
MQKAWTISAGISREREVVWLIPAGGKAERIAPLPGSKELLPIVFQKMPGSSQPHSTPEIS